MKQTFSKASTLILVLLGFCLFSIEVRSQQDALKDSSKTLTEVGQPMPPFRVTMLDGGEFDLAALKGKVVVVNFWATWCPPCLYEMPVLEKEVWQKYKGEGFAMVGIAREQSEREISAFRKEYGFSFPMAADPQREIYKLVATEGIPRSYVINREGVLVFQSVGFSPEEFSRMKKVIKEEIGKQQKKR